MLDNEQQYPLQMDVPAWYSDQPRPVPSMLDENEFDADYGVECQLRGCLAPLGLVALVWACLVGAALAAQPAAGLFALQQPPQPNGSLRIITEQQLRLPAIDGVIIRLHCKDVLKVNKKTGAETFDFAWLDGQVARVRKTGKKFGLLLMSDGVAKPWQNPFADRFNRVTKELGARYPDCVAWFPGGAISPPGSSEEPHWRNPMPAECVPAFKRQVDVAVAAFPRASLLWPISAKDRSGRVEQCAAYLAAVARGRAMLGHNALKLKDKPPQTPAQWLQVPHNKLATDLAIWHGTGVEFEMVSPTVENHKGTNIPRAGTRNINECIAQAKKLAAMAGTTDLHVRIYPDDLAKAGGLR